MPTFVHHAFGCKVNQYDLERARRHLVSRGFESVEHDADLVLLATCAVTTDAASDGRQKVRSLMRSHPRARIAVLGCISEQDRGFYEALTGPVTIVPSARDDHFLDRLEPLLPAARSAPDRVPRLRTRTFVKIEDGCDLSCSFCIIPSIRGSARSRPIQQILTEIEEAVAERSREIVLTGVHLGHYGRRSPDSLPKLLRAIGRLQGDFRVRLSSLEVSELTTELLDLLADDPRFVAHLHLPLQSGSETVLRRMRRPYTAARFEHEVEAVRSRLSEPSVSTDIIVGFPEETEADFEDTIDLCRRVRFCRVHVFPFSPREGTRAFAMSPRVSPAQSRRRRNALLHLAEDLARHSRATRIGKECQVLVERIETDGSASGLDERYHRVMIRPAHPLQRGDLARVQVVSQSDGKLIATLRGTPRTRTETTP